MITAYLDHWNKLPAFARWLLLATILGLIGVLADQASGMETRAQAQRNNLVFKSANTVYFNGPITESSVAETLTILDSDPGISQLSINSGGGWPEPAKKLADKIIELRLSIEVRENCLSACLLFVFPAGTERTVTEGAALGFHFAPPYDYLLLKDQASEKELVRAKYIYDNFVEILASAKADPRVVSEQGQMLEPLCWRYQTNNLNQKEAVVVYKYSLWFPDKAYFSSRSMVFQGSVISDSANSEEYMLAKIKAPVHLGPNVDGRMIRFGQYASTIPKKESQKINPCRNGSR